MSTAIGAWMSEVLFVGCPTKSESGWFLMSNSGDLVLTERLKRYRALAENAARLAAEAVLPSEKELYASIAARWAKAAEDLQKEIDGRTA